MSRRHRRLLGDASVPDDLASLFAVERARSEVVRPEVEDRVWGRVGATLGIVSPGGAGGSGSDEGPGGPEAPRGDGPGTDGATSGPDAAGGGGDLGSVTAENATAAAAGGASSYAAGGWLATKGAKIVLGLSIAAASTGGLALSRSASKTPADALAVAPTVTANAAPAMSPPTDGSSAPSRGVAPDAPATSRATASASPGSAEALRDAELEAERAVLEHARVSLGAGDATGALAQLAEHAARFPRGRLGDEREALAIRALVAAGRRDEARARFQRFRARSPQSILLPSIEAFVEGP